MAHALGDAGALQVGGERLVVGVAELRPVAVLLGTAVAAEVGVDRHQPDAVGGRRGRARSSSVRGSFRSRRSAPGRAANGRRPTAAAPGPASAIRGPARSPRAPGPKAVARRRSRRAAGDQPGAQPAAQLHRRGLRGVDEHRQVGGGRRVPVEAVGARLGDLAETRRAAAAETMTSRTRAVSSSTSSARKPVSPSTIDSRRPPTRSATVGVPRIAASITV